MGFPNAKALAVASPEPKGGVRKSLAGFFDFTGSATALPLSMNCDDAGVDAFRGTFIDNSLNGSAVVLTIYPSGQQLYVPQYSQAFYPFIAVAPKIDITATSAGGVQVPAQLLNWAPELMVWSVQGGGVVTNTVTVQGTVTAQAQGGAYTDRSGVINAGAAVIALNGARKRLFIQNPTSAAGQGIAAAEAIFVNYGAVAGIDNGASIELQPGQSLDTGLGPCPTQAIYINATTAGHKFIAREM